MENKMILKNEPIYKGELVVKEEPKIVESGIDEDGNIRIVVELPYEEETTWEPWERWKRRGDYKALRKRMGWDK